MADTDFSSALFSPMFASATMARIYSDHGFLQAMLDFEAALAAAEADVGIVPRSAAEAIAAACDASLYDVVALGEAAAPAGNVAIPLVKALTARVDAAARGYVHWGATSQDVGDTAFMLVARQALAHVRAELRSSMQALVALIGAHRGTLMPGRTLMQQALPITFAYKAAAWLAGLHAADGRLRGLEQEGLVVQLGGAAGTLAALGKDGLAVRGALAARLELAEPEITWHTERSRVADIAATLAGLSGACAKIATDVLLLMQTEVGEAFEPAAEGKGGSSTMPHKRNPMGCVAIRANHRRIAGLMATLVMGMEQEHERAAGGWAAEWETLRELFCLSAGSIERLREILAGLEVDPARMRRNLDAALGLPLAESLTMALAPTVGRQAAHHIVEAASKRALAEARTLGEIAKADPAIAGKLSGEAIDAALDPENYLGSADAMIDAILSETRRTTGSD